MLCPFQRPRRSVAGRPPPARSILQALATMMRKGVLLAVAAVAALGLRVRIRLFQDLVGIEEICASVHRPCSVTTATPSTLMYSSPSPRA